MNLAPVGSAGAGAGRWGQLDMAGELSAWVLDAYAASYPDPCVNCAYLGPQSPLAEVAIRSRAYAYALQPSSASHFSSFTVTDLPASGYDYVGLRAREAREDRVQLMR